MDIPRIVAYVQSGDADPTQNHYIPLVNKTGQTNKSLIKLNNKPMIQYVLEAIDGCPYISDIVISGIQPKDIEPYSPSKNCYYIQSGKTAFESTIIGINFVNSFENPPDYMCNIPSDLPLISTQVINKVFESIDWSKNFEIYQNWVREETIRLHYPKATKKIQKFKNGHFAGGDFYIYHPSILTPKRLKITEALMKNRKNFVMGAKVIGMGLFIKIILKILSIEDILRRFKKLGVRGSIYITDFPETCVDLDYVEDIDIFEEYCQSPNRDITNDQPIIFISTDDV